MSVTTQRGHKRGGRSDGHGERQVLSIILNILSILLWYFSAFKKEKKTPNNTNYPTLPHFQILRPKFNACNNFLKH